MDFISILLWVVFGVLVGYLANRLTRRNSLGLLGNVITGILGTFLGGWLSNLLDINGSNSISFLGFLISVAGACLLIYVVNLLRKLVK